MGDIEEGRLHSIIDVAIDGLPSSARAAHRSVVGVGSAHIVVVLHGQAVVRVARDLNVTSRMKIRQNLVDSIPSSFGFLLPRSLGPVVEVDGLCAVVTELIPGAPCPAGDGDPHELKRLLTEVASVRTDQIEPLLTEPLEFCGGSDWYRVQMNEVIPRLEHDVRGRALAAVAALANLETIRDVFSHGDLAGHNVFWEGGHITGVIDWDLASRSDLSTDLACVGVWNGWHKLPLLASSSDVHRATVRRNTFRLQQVAFVLLSGRPTEEVNAAAARAGTWLRENL